MGDDKKIRYALSRYRPHKNAERLHRSASLEIVSDSAARSGKTTALRVETIVNGWNNPTPYADLICAPTWRMVRNIHERPIVNWFRSVGALADFNSEDHRLLLKNGNVILFRSLEDPEIAVSGLDIRNASIDEFTLCSENAVELVRARLILTNGRLILIGTPKGLNCWAYERYFSPDAKPPKNCERIRFSIHDNPAIDNAAIERMKADLSPQMVRQEIYGEWISLTQDRVYSEYNREEHTCIGTPPYVRSQVIIGIDYNVRIMAWVALVRDVNDGKLYVIDEGWGCHTVRDVGEALYRKFGGDVLIVDDASGNSDNQQTGKTNRQILNQCGFWNIVRASKNPLRTARYANVNAHFVNGLGQNHLMISSKCETVARELESLTYKEGTDRPDDRDGRAGHITDALGYAVWYASSGQVAWATAA